MLLGMASIATGCGKKEQPQITQINTDERGSIPVVGGTTEPISVDQRASVPSVSFRDAESAYQAKHYDEAVTLYTEYTTSKPENPWGHYMLGLSAWKSKDLDVAESEFLRSIELDSSHVKSRINLARVYLDKGEKEKAAEQVESGLKLDSTSAEGFRLLGRVRDEQGQLVEAEHAYRQALKLDGEDAWSMNNLGLNFIKQDRGDEAIGVLARATQIKPDNARFQNNLGMALELNGYFVKAGEAYTKATQIDGSYQKAIDNLARVTGHEDKPGVRELNLEELAQNFVTEIGASKVSSN
jgi:Flp pilus assembly protein TadD